MNVKNSKGIVNRDTQNAMMASLGIISDYTFTDEAKVDKIASNAMNNDMEKIAGIFIDHPTVENINEFVKNYMLNELSFFPRILDISVDLIPSSFDKASKDNVSEGSGLIQIKVRSKNVEIPFIVRQGELEPFDIIQMDKQRVPFSRENLQRIIINLDHQEDMREKGQEMGDDSPYAGLEKAVNPSTSNGFVGDVLSIRDSQTARRGPANYVVADEEFCNSFEKFGFKKSAEFREDHRVPKQKKIQTPNTVRAFLPSLFGLSPRSQKHVDINWNKAIFIPTEKAQTYYNPNWYTQLEKAYPDLKGKIDFKNLIPIATDGKGNYLFEDKINKNQYDFVANSKEKFFKRISKFIKTASDIVEETTFSKVANVTENKIKTASEIVADFVK